MIETFAALSAQQQTLWATIAQVNAAVIIALVVEIGAAARRHRARAILEGDIRELWATALNFVAVIAYLAAGGAAIFGLFLSLAYLQAGENATQHDATQGAVWTLLAVIFVLVGPLLALVQYVISTIAEGAIDFIKVVGMIKERRVRSRRNWSKRAL